MILTAEQHKFLADELLMKPGMMAFNQELIHLLEVADPDPYVIASLIIKEYLPLKQKLPRNYEKKVHKQTKEAVDTWLIQVYHWIQANKKEIDEYQGTRRYNANRKNPDLNPKWGCFLILAREMMKDYQFCMCCKQQGGNLQIDHVKPARLGGGEFSLNNVQMLCNRCNVAKSSREADHRPPEFKRHVRNFIEQHQEAYHRVLDMGQPSKAWLSNQPILMKRVMHKSVA